MKTKNIFKNFYYRDSDIDEWLPKEQPEEELGNVQCHKMDKEMTFKEMCQEFLGITDEKELLKYRFTLPQIEELTKDPEKYDLRIDGWGNFFPVLEKDEKTVCVVNVYRGDSRWNVDVYRLGDDYVWSAGYRFFSRNLDTKELNSSDTSDLEQRVKALEVWQDKVEAWARRTL